MPWSKPALNRSATPARPSILVWFELPPEPLVPVPIAKRLKGTAIGPSFTRSWAYFLVVPANNWRGNGSSAMAPAAAELRKKKSRRFISAPVSQLITIGGSGARDCASAIIANSMTGPANKKNVAIGLMIVWISMPSEAQDRSEARSMVISRYGIVATSQTLASQAGAQILARGGSAMDAAIAANAALGVVEPMSNGIGGDLFAIYWEAKTGKLTGINSSGWSAAAQTLDSLKKKGYSSMPEEGIHSVTVPGCVAGWEKLHKKFGRLGWGELFRPAIYYAQEGFPVTEIIQGHWRISTPKLAGDEGARKLFLRDGIAPAIGDIF